MNTLINSNALTKGWKRYQIMHIDRRVASIREDGTCTIYSPSFMPYNLFLEEINIDNSDAIETRVNNLTNFYYWCASRVLTLDRKYAKEILAGIGASQATTDKERAQIALSYHCLCLTDVYWVRTDGDKTSFDSICLYHHSLTDAFVDLALSGKHLTAQNAELIAPQDIASDVSTQGVAPKAWIREDGIFYLLKNGNERDVKAELLASKIVDCFHVSHVSYSEAVFEGKSVSKSRLITSLQYSIVPMEYIEIYCINHNINRDKFIRKVAYFDFCMMNIVDYLIGNTDRHWGNWGFLIDNKTNKPIGLYPLMDFNKAFNAYTTIDGAKCQTASNHISQKDAAIDAVKQIGLNMIANVEACWFKDSDIYNMFVKRLNLLKSVTQI